MRLSEPLPPIPDPVFRMWKTLLEMDPRVRTVTAAYTADSTDQTILCDATGAAFALTLPATATNKGKILVVKRINSGANAVTVTADGSDTIEGSGTSALAAQYDSLTLQSDGAGLWIILATT